MNTKARSMKMLRWVGLIALAIVCVGLAAKWLVEKEFDRFAQSRTDVAPKQFGGGSRTTPQHCAGYGWSINPETVSAVRQALTASQRPSSAEDELVLVFYTGQHDPKTIVSALRQGNRRTKILGWSSDLGVITPDGYHDSPGGSLGLLWLHPHGISAGVGAASLDEADSPAACARLALQRARADAGPGAAGKANKLILMSSTFDAHEELYVQALSEAAPGTPIMGGTASSREINGRACCSLVAGDKVVHKGLVVAILSCDREFHWAIRGGFDRTSKNGVITASTGRMIEEIDNRPALDVYDEWAGGNITAARRAGEDMSAVTALYPLCRTLTEGRASHNLFIHAWPAGNREDDKRLVCFANLQKGDVIHFGEGSWNILLNRAGALPQLALNGKPPTSVSAGLLVCCQGILRTIPPDQRGQIARLINLQLGDVPWIGMFTWGEQGNFTGVGNHHGNLLTGLTLLPAAVEAKLGNGTKHR